MPLPPYPLRVWYVVHPPFPLIQDWLREAEAVLRKEFPDCRLRCFESDSRGHFKLSPVLSAVGSKRGPVILIRPCQKDIVHHLRASLEYCVPIATVAVGDSTDLYGLLLDLAKRFQGGEPQLPRRFVVALLIIRKLHAYHAWTGKAKGYIWAEYIPKGRGIPEEFKDVVMDIVNTLFLEGILTQKTSNGKKKYALNPDRREEIMLTLRDRRFHDERVQKILVRDEATVSARYLDILDSLDQDLEISGTDA